MKATIGLILLSAMHASLVWAQNAYYCPGNQAFIRPGMTTNQVLSACGQPMQKQASDNPVTMRVKVKQLLYNNLGTDTAFYGVWKIPTGSGGASLEVDIIDDKVVSARLNGTNMGGFSVCGNQQIQVGDNIGKVLGACGSPSMQNETFVERVVPGNNKTAIWTYQATPYQPKVTLTFVNGKLQSINKPSN